MQDMSEKMAILYSIAFLLATALAWSLGGWAAMIWFLVGATAESLLLRICREKR